MKYNDVYIEFNNFYYECLNIIRNNAKNIKRYEEFLNEIVNKNINIDRIIYKKIIDDYEKVCIDDKEVLLLPMGLINNNVGSRFINSNYKGVNGRFRLNEFHELFLYEKKFVPFYYPNDTRKINLDNFKEICKSYIEHYKLLKEYWSEADFYKMLLELKYLSVKYAYNEGTKEIFAVGFFGASVRNGAGGKALTNTELYVLPQFRGLGIAQKMVGLSLDLAKKDSIENFDSITYRIMDNDALKFWEKIGASVSGLIHIEGNVDEMLNKIYKKENKK